MISVGALAIGYLVMKYFLHLIQPFGRCVQYAVWLHLHPDAVSCRSVALRWNVGAGRGGVRPVLQ